MGRVVRATPMEPAVERAVRICPSRGHSPGAARPPNAVRSAALGRGREPQTAEGLGRSRHQLSALGKRGCPTDSEFCWQATYVCKPVCTKLTQHGVYPVQKRAPPSAADRSKKVGNDGTASILQQQFPVR
jgi:hypothetical protein